MTLTIGTSSIEMVLLSFLLLPSCNKNRSSSPFARKARSTFLLNLPYSPPIYSGNGLGLLVKSALFPMRSSTNASPQSYVMRSLHQLGNGGWGVSLASAAFFAASLAACLISSGGIFPSSNNAVNFGLFSIRACSSFTFSKYTPSCFFKDSSSWAIAIRRAWVSACSNFRGPALEFGGECLWISYSAARRRRWYFLLCLRVGGRVRSDVAPRSCFPAK
mmetsp:Transcript_39812/g.83202  ORF Transcript_39812/g.83202 Transcript_39812/m.83202 type:complete len:218 (-) Transcript_39812:134-787(-)